MCTILIHFNGEKVCLYFKLIVLSRCHCQCVGVNTMLYNYTIFSFLDSVKKAKRYTYKLYLKKLPNKLSTLITSVMYAL